jgi:CBS domain-containing protein
MLCSELMKTDVEKCGAEEGVEVIAERMRARNVGFLPVCDDHGRVIGTLTDRDLVLRVLAEHRDPNATAVADVMTSDVIACRPSDELSVAEALMSKYKKSRILCLDDDGCAAGIISLSDVARTETAGKASAILRSVSQREARP